MRSATNPGAEGPVRGLWARAGLQLRFVVGATSILLLILVAQSVVSLSSELADRERRVASRGTAVAQAAAEVAARLLHYGSRDDFDRLVARVGGTIDVLELAVVGADGLVVAHTDPSRVGRPADPSRYGEEGQPRAHVGLDALFDGTTDHAVRAPIVVEGRAEGWVGLRFRSLEITQYVRGAMLPALGTGLLWLALGAVASWILMRRITQPLVALTGAAAAISEGRLDEADLAPTGGRDELSRLQDTFAHLVRALRDERERKAELMAELRRVNEGLRGQVDAVTADLQATTAYLESVLRSMDEGVITCDREGRIVRANQGASRQLSGLGEPRPGAPIGGVVPGGEALAQAVREAVEEGAARDVALVRRNGAGERVVALRVNPLAGAEGQTMGAVVTLVDETGKRRVEAELRRHDRLISLGTLAAGLAHELGNMMHAINGYSGLLLREMAADDPRRRDVATIHQENGRAVELLDRFLEFARPSEMPHRPEPIDALVREALDVAGLRLRRLRVDVREELGADGVLVCCDPRQLTQVLVNLVLNAVDAMGQSDERVLTVGSLLVEGEGGPRVRLWVSDTGHGIPAEHLDRIWDPFFTTKVETGTGLGLSIAHQIVDRHGGSIAARSGEGEDGGGATFTVELPVEQAPRGEGGDVQG